MNFDEFKHMFSDPAYFQLEESKGVTELYKIQSHGIIETINLSEDIKFRSGAYCIDATHCVTGLNEIVYHAKPIDAEQWQNALNQLKQFIPEN